MKYAYEMFLSLYPASWLVRFGREMTDVFEQAAQDYRSRGLLALWTFLCMEFGGLIVGAVAEWSGENSRRGLGGRRWTAPFAIAIVAGLGVAWFVQSVMYRGLASRHHVIAARPSQIPATPQLIGLLALIGICILVVSLLSLAFVWNMRTIGNRAGRLKPIWMPGRSVQRRQMKRDYESRRNTERRRRRIDEGLRLHLTD